jgi:DNA-directed RNA polymerase subunit L
MKLEFGLTTETFNTQCAPLTVLLACYRQEDQLQPLANVLVKMKTRHFSPIDELEQVLVRILAGCDTLSEVNTAFKPDL